MKGIPLVDLAWQRDVVADDVARGFAAVFARTAFILGPEVAAFESAYAAFEGVAHVVGVANGTDAIELALRAVDVGPGDEVILPANTFVATAVAAMRLGAVPVLVDCDERFHLIDPERVAARVGEKTRAIVPVHLYGQLAPTARVKAIADAAGAVVVEDAAQCQGARHDGRGPGAIGAVAATSFYPGKNLGAYGDAGAVSTSSPDVARRLRALRNYGGEAKYVHDEVGFNSRLDTLQAVVLSAKLARLAAWNELRRVAAARYDDLLRDVADVATPATAPGNEHVYHLYVVRVPRRDAVLARMQADGVGVGVHYPRPLHELPALAPLGHRAGDFPVAERAAREILSLPMYPGITAEQQERVVASLRRALER